MRTPGAGLCSSHGLQHFPSTPFRELAFFPKVLIHSSRPHAVSVRSGRSTSLCSSGLLLLESTLHLSCCLAHWAGRSGLKDGLLWGSSWNPAPLPSGYPHPGVSVYHNCHLPTVLDSVPCASQVHAGQLLLLWPLLASDEVWFLSRSGQGLWLNERAAVFCVWSLSLRGRGQSICPAGTW